MNGSNVSLFCAGAAAGGQEATTKIMAYSMILVLGLIGNILTIVVVCREKSLHNTVNYLIVNMAISDLVIPIIVLPYQLFHLVNAKNVSVWVVSGDFGTFLCKLFFFLADISPPVSVLSLVFITIDRFCAIMFPLRAGAAPLAHANKFLITMTWIIAAMFMSPNLYSYKLASDGDYTVCKAQFSDDPIQDFKINQILHTIVTAFFIILPFFILTIMYTMILLRLRQQDRSAMALSQSKKERIMRYQKTRRVVIMALTVIVVFAVSWIPLNVFVFLIYHVFDPNEFHKRCRFFRILAFTIQFLGYANPVFNPIIYFVFIEKFRKGLYNCMTCKKTLPQHTTFYSEGRENSGRTVRPMIVFDSPRTRASSNASLQLKTHKF